MDTVSMLLIASHIFHCIHTHNAHPSLCWRTETVQIISLATTGIIVLMTTKDFWCCCPYIFIKTFFFNDVFSRLPAKHSLFRLPSGLIHWNGHHVPFSSYQETDFYIATNLLFLRCYFLIYFFFLHYTRKSVATGYNPKWKKELWWNSGNNFLKCRKIVMKKENI